MRLKRWIAAAMCLLLCGCASPSDSGRVLISHSTDGAPRQESTAAESVVLESTAEESRKTDPPETETVESSETDTAEEQPTESAAETETVTYVLNTNTKKFHRADCSSVKDIKEKNRAEFSGDRAELIDRGYQPCKRCNP